MVVTVMWTVPAASAGDVAVHDVVEVQLECEASVDPKSTVWPIWNPVPVMVTEVPPVVGPTAGLTALIEAGP